MTRVFLADDHPMVRLGLRQILTEVGGFEVIGEAADGRKVLSSPELGGCDVLVLDLSLPVISGLEVLRRVRNQHPGLAVVVHSMHAESLFRRRVLDAGAVAFVAKDAPPAELLEAVRRAGRSMTSDDAAEHEASGAVPPHEQLTAREHEVFVLVLLGRQVTDIAAELDVHASTVSNHLAKVRQKLGVRTTAEIVHYAYGAGLVAAPPSDQQASDSRNAEEAS